VTGKRASNFFNWEAVWTYGCHDWSITLCLPPLLFFSFHKFHILVTPFLMNRTEFITLSCQTHFHYLRRLRAYGGTSEKS
jgi:hypothetical protein